MKKQFYLVLLFLLGFKTIAQETGNDTYTIQRLIIENDKEEILLEKHKNGWMTPALRQNKAVSIQNGLQSLAKEFGLEISNLKLAGKFMFIHKYKKKASVREYYLTDKVSGNLKIPTGKLNAQWFSKEKAIKMMSLPDAKLIGAVKDMTQQVLENPNSVSGGTFLLWKENGKTQYKLIEGYYSVTKEPTELEKINKVLLDYIDGTANGQPERVQNAFHKDLKLYHVKNDSLVIWNGTNYVNNIIKGKKSGRIGRVVSVDYENDAGVAKIEIDIPYFKRIYTDYLLLLKVNGRWKIIHKSFTFKPYFQKKN